MWAWVGLGAQVLLVVSWIAAGFWQGPQYSLVSDSISDLYAATAPAGLLLAIVIGLCGLGTILFAGLSVWPSLRGAAGGDRFRAPCSVDLRARRSPRPTRSGSLSYRRPGVQPSDQLATFGGLLDAVSSIPGILFFIVAVFVLAGAMARTPNGAIWPVRAGGWGSPSSSCWWRPSWLR